MKLYMAAGAQFIGVLYLLALVLLWIKLGAPLVTRLGVTTVVAVVGAAILYWDVVITSVQMHARCPTAGIALKQAVRADGYYTNLGGADDLNRGFKYIEVRSGHLVRLYEQVGGEVRRTQIDTAAAPYVPRSRYELISGQVKPLDGLANIASRRSEVRDRLSGEVLGTATTYTAYPGWIDRNTVGLIGKVIWVCPEEQGQTSRLLTLAILPNQ